MTNTNDHITYMKRALELAEKGLGHVAPNPMVGCVIVHKGLIIGQGYHRRYGEAHAEVNAIHSVLDPSLLSESTVYVTLEPCAHFGKTPPCAHLLIAKKVKHVVVAAQDPFPAVSGKGIQLLRDAGIEVTVGICEAEARFLNRRFLTSIEKKRPYVILKWAESSDGFIDIDRSAHQKGVFWITELPAQQLVHLWRTQEPGIAIGGHTVIIDNPQLTARHVIGAQPTRFVMEGSQKIPADAAIFSSDSPTHVMPSSLRSPHEWLSFIHDKGIQSVIIEGGARILNAFIQSGLWDEARVFTGKNKIEKGLQAPTLSIRASDQCAIGNDLLSTYYNL